MPLGWRLAGLRMGIVLRVQRGKLRGAPPSPVHSKQSLRPLGVDDSELADSHPPLTAAKLKSGN